MTHATAAPIDKRDRRQIQGRFAYALQGFMHAESILRPRYLDPSRVNDPLGTVAGELDANLAQLDVGGQQTTLTDLPQLLQISGFRPPSNDATDEAITIRGFYPCAEVGYIDFRSPDDAEGWARVNTAGYSSNALAHFKAGYRFDHDPDLITGFITLQFTDLPNHVWDYAFVRVSDDFAEFLLSVAGRFPRPGTLTGTMRLIR